MSENERQIWATVEVPNMDMVSSSDFPRSRRPNARHRVRSRANLDIVSPIGIYRRNFTKFYSAMRLRKPGNLN